MPDCFRCLYVPSKFWASARPVPEPSAEKQSQCRGSDAGVQNIRKRSVDTHLYMRDTLTRNSCRRITFDLSGRDPHHECRPAIKENLDALRIRSKWSKHVQPNVRRLRRTESMNAGSDDFPRRHRSGHQTKRIYNASKFVVVVIPARIEAAVVGQGSRRCSINTTRAASTSSLSTITALIRQLWPRAFMNV